MAKLLIFLFCWLLSVTGCSVKQEQDNGSASLMANGTTGELKWELGEDGTLSISGKGEMPDYNYDFVNEEYHFPSPWYEYRENITNVIIGDEVSAIGEAAFAGFSKMTSVDIGNSVTIIGKNSFVSSKSLTSIVIPNSVITIGSWAFSYCTNLTSVTIGSSVSTIEDSAFRMCGNLSEIINYREIPQIIQLYMISELSSFPFVGIDRANCTLFVPIGSVESYRSNEVWNWFVNIKEIQ